MTLILSDVKYNFTTEAFESDIQLNLDESDTSAMLEAKFIALVRKY